MRTWHLLVLAALCACVETRDVEIGTGRHVMELTEETPEAQVLREYAFSAWADVGVEAPADYRLGLLTTTELQVACETNPDHTVGGCAFQEERVVLIASDLPPASQQWLAVHEVGHLTRGRHGHLECDRAGKGPDIMCPKSRGASLTARDIAFALSADESP
jgi:hypothetical protein